MKQQAYDIEAEYRMLGGSMKSSDQAMEVYSHIGAHHLYCPKSREIFDSLRSLIESGSEVTLTTIEAKIGKKEAKIDDLVNIYSLGNESLDVKEFIDRIKSCYHKRQMALACEDIGQEAKGEKPFKEVLRFAEGKLFSISEEEGRKAFRHISEAFKDPRDYLKELERRVEAFHSGSRLIDGIPTGYLDLDKHIQAWKPGHFCLIGARPGVGKTTFALNLIEQQIFKFNSGVMFFSLEMPNSEIVSKLIAQVCRIDLQKIQEGNLSREELEKIERHMNFFKEKKLYLDDSSSLSIDQIKARAYRAKRLYGVQIVVIDYIQLVKSPGHENRYLEIGDISRKCKEMSKELGVTVIALAQLNRQLENRTSKEPFLSDLRESGSLEADADEILLLHRPEMYDQNAKPGLLDAYLAKNRFGPTGLLTFVYNKKMGAIDNYAKP